MPSLKLISATDTEYSSAVLKSLNEQRINGLFCDITVIIRDKKFRAHKTILAASSTYFHQLFTVAGQVIELNFIRAEIFEEILNYIYTSKIVRVRSDKLEELIQAGKILGVKFIANLASPLSQVKGLPGLSSKTDSKTDAEVMPIITESFSISAEEFHQSSKPDENDEESDSDVMFVSTTTNQKVCTEVIDLESMEDTSTSNVPQEDAGSHKTFSVKPPQSDTKSSRSPNVNSNSVSSPGSATKAPTTSKSFSPSGASLSPQNNNILGVQRKQVSTPIAPEDDLKIRLLDVAPPSAVPTHSKIFSSKGTEQTVTLKTAAEISSMSPDCKVYANIGEDTYDIVKMKEDPDEGGSAESNADRAYMISLTKRIDELPTPPPKKAKGDESQYYELVMDGKTFYVCLVCKRPYVCLTSVRRHFNTHSWEKKYPCRHCNKVFALAEYRTKHELIHTQERRYQCLLCHEMFLNYQCLCSHMKGVHNQDPSGKREKGDAENTLYRLLPCKTVKIKKMHSWVTDEDEVDIKPIMSDAVRITTADQHDSAERSMLNWDEIFMEPDGNSQPGSSVNNSSKRDPQYDFIIPESF